MLRLALKMQDFEQIFCCWKTVPNKSGTGIGGAGTETGTGAGNETGPGAGTETVPYRYQNFSK